MNNPHRLQNLCEQITPHGAHNLTGLHIICKTQREKAEVRVWRYSVTQGM